MCMWGSTGHVFCASGNYSDRSIFYCFFTSIYFTCTVGDNLLWVESTVEGGQQPIPPQTAAKELHQTAQCAAVEEDQAIRVSARCRWLYSTFQQCVLENLVSYTVFICSCLD